jgi:hypothetical protein
VKMRNKDWWGFMKRCMSGMEHVSPSVWYAQSYHNSSYWPHRSTLDRSDIGRMIRLHSYC